MFVDSPSRVLPRLRDRLRDLIHRGTKLMTAPVVATVMLSVFCSAVPLDAATAAKPKAKPAATAKAPKRDRYAAIVVDAATGEVLHAENSNVQNYPASMTKMMTLYLAFEALEAGTLTLDTRIPISAHAASMPPSKLGIKPGGTIRVEDAIKALVTKSANDIAAAMGEAVGGGTESGGAAVMTRKARALGMSRTTFKNASGLPNAEQKSTARDMAILAQALIYRFPQYYPYFNTRSFTYNGHTHRNHNGLLGKVDGLDGMKTGFINASGFNMTVSARRDGRRVIAVVFGGDTVAWRNQRATWLVEESFKPGHGQLSVRAGESREPVRYKGFTGAPAAPAQTAPAGDALVASTALPALRHPGEKPDAPALTALVEELSREPATAQLTAAVATTQLQSASTLTADGARPVIISRSVTGNQAVAAMTGAAVAEPAMVTASGWGVQIGAYKDEPAGSAAVRDISTRMPSVLAMAKPSVIPVTTPRGTLYRARLMGLSEQNARAVCENLTREGRGCLTVPPPALTR